MLDVSSSFKCQTRYRMLEPVRKFYISTSDYSDLVVTWPKIKKKASGLGSVSLTVKIANTDGAMNEFYKGQYKLKDELKFTMGVTSESIDLYTGEISKVSYSKNSCVIKTRDKMWGFAQRVVGESETPVKIPPSSQYLISDIAWTLCTCYGELDGTQDSSNPDINYETFETWAEQFSINNIFGQSYYTGDKVIGALTKLANMNDSAIWVEGDGKLNFKKFDSVGSDDIAFTDGEMGGLQIDIDMDRLINKQWVYFNYAVDSDYWQSNVFNVETTSVNTFGLRENILKDKSFWFVDSVSALNMATRKTALLNQPNREFNFVIGMGGLQTQVGDTVRLVNSFYDLTSGQGWTVDEITYDMHNVKNKYHVSGSLVLDGFYLDVSTLDGDMLLL